MFQQTTNEQSIHSNTVIIIQTVNYPHPLTIEIENRLKQDTVNRINLNKTRKRRLDSKMKSTIKSINRCLTSDTPFLNSSNDLVLYKLLFI